MEWLKEALSVMMSNGWVDFIVYIFLGCLAGHVIGRIFKGLQSIESLPSQALRLLQRIIKGIIWALVFVQGLRALGVDVVSILGAAGVMGVAIGFASQTSLSNLISGIFLISERSFKQGDYIKVGESKVYFADVTVYDLTAEDDAKIEVEASDIAKDDEIVYMANAEGMTLVFIVG